MTRFNSKLGALVFLALCAIYATLALFKGHSAASVPPTPIATDGDGLTVWPALTLLAEAHESSAIVDVRSREQFARYHLPRSESAPAASSRELARRALGRKAVLLVADKDEVAAKLVAELKQTGAMHVHYLKEGVRDFYLVLELPVPLFAEREAPFGYEAAVQTVRDWLAGKTRLSAQAIQQKILFLTSTDYMPTLLKANKKAKPSAKRKAIAGGCG